MTGCLLVHALQMGGVYNGSITFMAPNGQYLWYTIQVGKEQACSASCFRV